MTMTAWFHRSACHSTLLVSYSILELEDDMEAYMRLRCIVLAVQNMEASGIVPRAQEIEFKALEGSLSMMSKGEQSPPLEAIHPV